MEYLCPMQSHFTIEIDATPFEFISMNVKRPQLFQVYVNHEGRKKRFHMKEDDKGNFVFALREDCPLLDFEEELSYRIKQRYDLAT
jgi:hypothetical protein